MATEIVKAPDLGGADEVDVIEVFVSAGDEITEDTLIVALETDKASMEVPAERAGKIAKVLVKEGDKISEGTPLLELESAGGGTEKAAEPTSEPETKAEEQAAPAAEQPAPAASGGGEEVTAVVPDIGSDDEVQIIEVNISVGDTISEGDTLAIWPVTA